ncbi:MAG TPA: hypothetical protein VHX62_13485 [Solirubrobacteraceae bacterium]|jgi:hypothetical protein|nr:hypothetical protein [Solirubrobacteraceae bacterium]
MSTGDQPTEEELRAAYEAEIKKIRVEQILLEQVVSLVNLGMRRTGLSPGTEDERDVGQVRVAIDAVRALLPLIEQSAPPQANAIRDALSQMQLAYVRLGGTGEPVGPSEPGASGGDPGGAGAGGGGAGEAGAGGAGDPAGPGGPGEPGSQGPPSPPPQPDAPEPGEPGEPGPAQRSGRLWVPGQ